MPHFSVPVDSRLRPRAAVDQFKPAQVDQYSGGGYTSVSLNRVTRDLQASPCKQAVDATCCKVFASSGPHIEQEMSATASNSTKPSTRLIRGAQGGDPEAVRLLVDRACTLSLRTTRAMIGGDEARDIAQDVAVEVLKSLDDLRDPPAFDAWVHRISSRRVGRYLRKRSLIRRREPIALENADLDEVLGDGDHSDLIALRLALSAALAELPVKQRLAVVLRYVHDLSDEEIASTLACRVGSVHSLLSRARTSLRRSEHLLDLRPLRHEGAS